MSMTRLGTKLGGGFLSKRLVAVTAVAALAVMTVPGTALAEQAVQGCTSSFCVGNDGYSSLADAVVGAPTGGVIQIAAGTHVITSDIAVDKNLSFELKPPQVGMLATEATLKFKQDMKLQIKATSSPVPTATPITTTVTVGSGVTMEGVGKALPAEQASFTGAKAAEAAVVDVQAGGKLVVNGGIVKSVAPAAISPAGLANFPTAVGVAVANGGALELKNGDITATGQLAAAVVARGGSQVDVSGGKITADTAGGATHDQASLKNYFTQLPGAAVGIGLEGETLATKVDVKGGEISATAKNASYSLASGIGVYGPKATVNLSKGTVQAAASSKMLATGIGMAGGKLNMTGGTVAGTAVTNTVPGRSYGVALTENATAIFDHTQRAANGDMKVSGNTSGVATGYVTATEINAGKDVLAKYQAYVAAAALAMANPTDVNLAAAAGGAQNTLIGSLSTVFGANGAFNTAKARIESLAVPYTNPDASARDNEKAALPASVTVGTPVNMQRIMQLNADNSAAAVDEFVANYSSSDPKTDAALTPVSDDQFTRTAATAGTYSYVAKMTRGISSSVQDATLTPAATVYVKVPLTFTAATSVNPPTPPTGGNTPPADDGKPADNDLQAPAGPQDITKPVDVGAANVIRGADRVATSLLISAQNELLTAKEAIIVSGASPIDGTVAAPLAIARKAPVIYGTATDITASAVERIKKGVTKVTLVGAARLSDSTRAQLKTLGVEVATIQGKDRYETAKLVAEAMPNAVSAYLANGVNLADPMVAAVAAGQNNGVVLLSNNTSAAEATTAYLAAHSNQAVTTVGGPASAAYPGKTALSGKNRYETAYILAASYMKANAPVFVTGGVTLIDAVPATVLAALRGGPLVYAAPNQNTAQVLEVLKAFTGKQSGPATYIGN